MKHDSVGFGREVDLIEVLEGFWVVLEDRFEDLEVHEGRAEEVGVADGQFIRFIKLRTELAAEGGDDVDLLQEDGQSLFLAEGAVIVHPLGNFLLQVARLVFKQEEVKLDIGAERKVADVVALGPEEEWLLGTFGEEGGDGSVRFEKSLFNQGKELLRCLVLDDSDFAIDRVAVFAKRLVLVFDTG